MFSGIITATVAIGCVGLFVGLFLGIAAIKFRVEVNPKEEEVLNALPGNNCGGCGFAGCSGLAHAIAEDTKQMLVPGIEIIVRGPITIVAQWQEIPQTGDPSRLSLWIMLMGMAGVGMLMLKKRAQN